MPRRTALGVLLLLVLFLAVPSPAAAKGPTRVEVRNLSTGTTTMLTWDQPELTALMELVEWPASRRKPHLVATGALKHVATLDWQFDDGQAVWLDRVFSDGAGTVWIARRDHLSGTGFVTWGRVRAAYALDVMVARLGDAEPAPAGPVATEPAHTVRTSTVGAASAFLFGAAAATLGVGGLSLVVSRRRSAPA
jgi:hypothetical protein